MSQEKCHSPGCLYETGLLISWIIDSPPDTQPPPPPPGKMKRDYYSSDMIINYEIMAFDK